MKERVRALSGKSRAWWNGLSRIQKLLLGVAVVVVVYFIFHHKDPLTGASVEAVKRQDLSRTVLASGTVVSTTDLGLSFQESDIVTSVNVWVGQKVKKGQVLATLQDRSEQAKVTQARGALLAAQAKYNKVLEGSSNEEIALAQVNLDSANKDLANTIATQKGLVDNARRKLFSDGLVAEAGNVTNESYTPAVSGTYTGDEGQYVFKINSSGDNYFAYSGLESGTGKVSSISPQPLGTKGLALTFPSATVSQAGTWTITIPNTAGVNYATNLNAYNAALDAQTAAVSSAQALVDQRQAELDLKKATARQPDIDAALADVITAQAQVEAATADLEKKILRAPADGTITRVDVHVGDRPEALKTIITLQDIGNLYIEANVNESDISMIAVGQPVTVTYDAFGSDEKYQASVSSVDLGSTVDDGIVNYKIKALIADTTNIKPGMTANLIIVTASHPGTLVIPARMITNSADKKTVQVLLDPRRGKTEARTIETGLYGDGDLVEITSGLTEGEKVVSFSTTK